MHIEIDLYPFSESIVKWLVLDYWLLVNSDHHAGVT